MKNLVSYVAILVGVLPFVACTTPKRGFQWYMAHPEYYIDMATLKMIVEKDDSWKNPRLKNEYGEGLLEMVCSHYYYPCPKHTEERIPYWPPPEGRTPTTEMVKYLVEHGAPMQNAEIGLRKLTDRAACSECKGKRKDIKKLINYLIQHGAKVEDGEGILFEARKDKEMTQFWIRKGLKRKDIVGSMLFLAEDCPHDIFRLYVDTIGIHTLTEEEKKRLLFNLISPKLKCLDKFKYIIKKGVDPTKYREDGVYTVLDCCYGALYPHVSRFYWVYPIHAEIVKEYMRKKGMEIPEKYRRKMDPKGWYY